MSRKLNNSTKVSQKCTDTVKSSRLIEIFWLDWSLLLNNRICKNSCCVIVKSHTQLFSFWLKTFVSVANNDIYKSSTRILSKRIREHPFKTGAGERGDLF